MTIGPLDRYIVTLPVAPSGKAGEDVDNAPCQNLQAGTAIGERQQSNAQAGTSGRSGLKRRGALSQERGVLWQVASRSCGQRSSKRTRAQLEAFSWTRYQQAAGWLAADIQTHNMDGWGSAQGQNAVSAIAMHNDAQQAAFVQTNGVLSLYRLSVLQHDAAAAMSKAHASRARSTSGAQGQGRDPSRGDPSHEASRGEDDDDEQSSPEDGEEDLTRRDERLMSTLTTLPMGGVRFNMQMKLDDAAWDPINPNRLGLVGSNTHYVTVVELAQGSRRRTMLKTGGTGASSLQQSGPGLSSLRYFPHGPYTLAAAGGNQAAVHLWDTRKGNTAVAELHTPGRLPLQAPVEVSHDGVLLYGLAQGNTLMVWDVRKGSSGSRGVLNFGASGPFHHSLLKSLDLNAPLLAAQTHFAPTLQVPPNGRAAPVDHIMVDPCDPTRLGFVMQNLCAGTVSLVNGGVTHFVAAPQLYHPPAATLTDLPSRYLTRSLKKGTWNQDGTALWVPHMLLPPPPVPEAEGSGAAAGAEGAAAAAAAAAAPTARPAVAAIGCNRGAHSRHAVAARDPPALAAALKAVSKAQAVFALDPNDAASAAAVAEAKARAEAKRFSVHRPPLTAVSDWVTCCAVHTSSGAVLAGTFGGQLLWLEQGRG